MYYLIQDICYFILPTRTRWKQKKNMRQELHTLKISQGIKIISTITIILFVGGRYQVVLIYIFLNAENLQTSKLEKVCLQDIVILILFWNDFNCI